MAMTSHPDPDAATTSSSSAPAPPAPRPPCCSPGGLRRAGRRPQPLRRRHAVDPRPDARRRAAAARWGLLDRDRRRRHPAGARTTFRYADETVPIDDQAVLRRRRPLRAAAHRARPDPRRRRGRRRRRRPLRRHGHRRQRDATRPGVGVTGRDRRRRPFTCEPARDRRRRHPLDGRRAGRRAGASTVGRVSARHVRLLVGLETDGYEWIFRPDAAAGVIPTNDGQACVFVGAHPPDRSGRGSRRHPEIVAESRPAGRRSSSPRDGTRRPCGPSPVGPATCAAVGPGLGARRRRRLLQGPAQRPRAHRRPARRRAARPRDRPRWSPTERSARRWPDYQATRDGCRWPCSTTVDVIAGHRWTDAEIPGLLCQLDAAMADEVEALAALPDVAPIEVPGPPGWWLGDALQSDRSARASERSSACGRTPTPQPTTSAQRL